MIVAGTETVTATLCATRDGDVVVVADTRPIKHILPVGIRVVTFLQGVLIQSCILTHLCERRTVHHRILLEEGLETDIAVVTHLGWCTHRTLHRGNHDDTIGTAATVDGCGGGILQDIHRLDVSRIDIRELPHEWNTVEHDQRVVRRTQGALSTDTDLHLGTRL